MANRPRAVRLALPAIFVAILMLIALWRISGPIAPADESPAAPLAPLTRIAEVLADNSVGRRASLENVVIREMPSARTLWIGTDGERAFVVLDPDVSNVSGVPIRPGTAVTLVGLVRSAPPAATAMSQWSIDAETAAALRERGTYLHVTEVRESRE